MRCNLSRWTPVMSVNAGMSDGGTVRAAIITPEGVVKSWTFLLKWNIHGSAKWYVPEEINSFWTVLRPELGNRSLEQVIRDEGVKVVCVSWWGADDVIWFGGDDFAAINYLTSFGDIAVKTWMDGIGAARGMEMFGLAPWFAFQPTGQLRWLTTNAGIDRGRWAQVRGVFPIPDYLHFKATGQKGHDRSMAQSQGAPTDAARRELEKLFREWLPSNTVWPWSDFDEFAIHEGLGGARFFPGTHDSPAGWNGLFAAKFPKVPRPRFANWTGSFNGATGCLAGLAMPSAEALVAANLVVEGFPLAINYNVGSVGAGLKIAKETSGLTWPAFETAMAQEAPFLFDAGLLKGNAVLDVMEIANLLGRERKPATPVSVGAAIINTAADTAGNILDRVAGVLGLTVDHVVLGGGWVENALYCRRLEQRVRNILIPPFAAVAASMGNVAKAILAAAKQDGVTDMTLADVLESLTPQAAA